MKRKKSLFEDGLGEVSILPVVNMESMKNIDTNNLPDALPILALRNIVLFPTTVIPISAGRKKSIQLIKDTYNTSKLIGTVSQRDISVEDPSIIDLYEVGTLAKIIKVIEMPDDSLTVILQGIKRFNVIEQISNQPYIFAKVNYLEDVSLEREHKDVKSLCKSIKESALEIISLTPHLPSEATLAIKNIDDFDFLINFIASSVEIEDPYQKINLLKENNVQIRGLKLLEILRHQIEILELKEDIQKKVHSEMDQQQREYYLNNQLKTIQEELGMNAQGDDFEDLRARASKKKWPEHAQKAFDFEMRKLERTNANSPDYNIQYQYVSLLVDLPWDTTTKDKLDLDNAMKILDKDHFGLESVKDRIIEYLAVLKLKGDMKSPIICLYGPPGVGKTSLGRSVARALGREYARISLGGLHDESEIRGHRKTYIGAMPGRIIQNIKKAGSSNPVIVLDEIDKISADFKGDPAYALLEALDPEQNNTFHDNYLDVDYDLSKVLFITTANDISNIHPALRDRMEMIPVNGYLLEEKVNIAQKYLVPKQLKDHGLKKVNVKLDKKTIELIIDEYTRESGVRGLDKQIAKLSRMSAKRIASNPEIKTVEINKKNIKEFLGLPINTHDIQKGNEAPGVVTGLAWTQVGGEILFIECSTCQGKGSISTTGNLGNVMKESATIAHKYLMANPEQIGLTFKDVSEKDIHIHVPQGAVPKDGPSAGITMVTALASALTKKMVKSAIAMTGEMTLRGKVLPVGGIKEKILAAKRAGITTIVLSEENRKDIEDIKDVYIKGLNFKYVKYISEVLDFVFG